MTDYLINETAKRKLTITIKAYDAVMKGIQEEALASIDRAYGGIVRAGKGALVENIATQLIDIAWNDILNQLSSRLTMNKTKINIEIQNDYILKIPNEIVKKYISDHLTDYIYKFGTDVHVFIDGKLVLPIECKAYTENAMLKRILFDATLMKEATGINNYFLLQLESQLGGDYSSLNKVIYGSKPTHTIMSHVDINLEIITLLKGERKVMAPIHKKEFYKELTLFQLERALLKFTSVLEKYKK